MLTIWTKTSQAKTLTALAPILKNNKELKYEFFSDFDALPYNPESTAVLALGKEPLLTMATAKLIPKNRTVTGLRLQPIAIPGIAARAIVSYNPGIMDVDYGKYVDLQTDAGAAVRLAVTGSIDPQYGKYEYVDNFKRYREEVEALYALTGKPVESALDLETLGLDPYLEPSLQHPGAYVVSIQLTHTVGTAQVVYLPGPKAEVAWFADKSLWEDLNWILTTPKISTRGANLKYDLHWLHKRAGIYCTNFKFDTTLVGSLLDENRSNGLDVHCKIYAPALGGYSDVFDRTIDKSRMDLVPKATMLPYAGGDSDATLRVSIAQKAELLKDPALTAFYVNIMHPAARSFELMEQGGMLVDKNAYEELKIDLTTEINSLANKARYILGGRIWAKHSDPSKPGGLNLTKASMLTDYMFSPMGLNLKPKTWTDGSYDAAGNLKSDPTPSTALDSLLEFSDVPEAKEFVELLRDYSSAVKTKGTYVDGFLKHLRSDGRYHPSYYFFAGNKDEGEGGTNTGRLSCKAPAFQCCKGASLVYNKDGWRTIESMVSGYEQGQSYTVLTHTGEWKPVVGVYRNGVKSLLKITTASGAVLECTDNHPWLTDLGFVQAGKLEVGTPVWRFYEEAASGGGVEGWPVDGDRGLGDVRGRASAVRVPVRVWYGERIDGQQPDWQEAEQILWLLQVGQTGNAWTQPERAGVVNLLELATHDSTVLRPERQGVQELWRKGDNSLFFLGRLIRELSKRYGGEACRQIIRQEGREWELRCNQLQVGDSIRAGTEPQEQCVLGVQRGTEACKRVGTAVRAESSDFAASRKERVEYDSSPYHASQAQEAGFVLDRIVSIDEVPAEETYDLTIEGSHSFIANGVIVHNTIPKHTKWAKALRRCYIAPDGYLVVERDYSQGELKVVACIANEQNMIQAYLNGLDLHIKTGGESMGLTYEQMLALRETNEELFDIYRQRGKPSNFGLLYGMGAAGFRTYSASSFGVQLTLSEAEDTRHKFLYVSYPGLVQYHNAYKAYAHKYGHVRSPLGRIRHLPLINSTHSGSRSEAERQSVNSPVQGCLSDMLLWTVALEEAQGLTATMPNFGACHDAAYSYVHEDRVDKDIAHGMEIMQNLPFHKVGWAPQLQFTADAKVGKNMADLKKWKAPA